MNKDKISCGHDVLSNAICTLASVSVTEKQTVSRG